MKNSTLLLSKVFLIVVDKFGCIVKVFDVVLSIPFRVVAGPVDKVFHNTAFTFFYYLFIK